MGNTSFILASIGVFLVVILLLVIILLVAKKYLSPSGNVNIEINGDKTINVPQGSSLMTTLNENGIFLPSACGGKASCGQCKVQVLEGGGEILDSEKPHFTRKQIKDHWRLGCQCKVKGDLKIKVPDVDAHEVHFVVGKIHHIKSLSALLTGAVFSLRGDIGAWSFSRTDSRLSLSRFGAS